MSDRRSLRIKLFFYYKHQQSWPARLQQNRGESHVKWNDHCINILLDDKPGLTSLTLLAFGAHLPSTIRKSHRAGEGWRSIRSLRTQSIYSILNARLTQMYSQYNSYVNVAILGTQESTVELQAPIIEIHSEMLSCADRCWHVTDFHRSRQPFSMASEAKMTLQNQPDLAVQSWIH